MKIKSLTITGIITLVFLLLTSCEDNDNGNIIWDIYPVYSDIYLMDAEGNNLLDPNTSGTLYGKQITVDYNGESFSVNWKPETEDTTRAYLAVFKGLTFVKGYSLGESQTPTLLNENHLNFGEFDGAKNQNISFTLKIEGYTQSWEVNFIHNYKWKNGKPVISNHATLNGENVDGYSIEIIL